MENGAFPRQISHIGHKPEYNPRAAQLLWLYCLWFQLLQPLFIVNVGVYSVVNVLIKF